MIFKDCNSDNFINGNTGCNKFLRGCSSKVYLIQGQKPLLGKVAIVKRCGERKAGAKISFANITVKLNVCQIQNHQIYEGKKVILNLRQI